MRRADRLFRIVQLLRSGRLITAKRLAEKLEVSERTIYRDVRDLQLSGTPIEGEAGIGYVLRRDFDIPPLMFTRSEITALVLGARMVKSWGSAEWVEGAKSSLLKIEAVLPENLRNRLDETLLYAPGFLVGEQHKQYLDILHLAAVERRFVAFTYIREDGEETRRRVRPLALYFWGRTWTLAAWCEMRKDFRSFRMDRMQSVVVSDVTFKAESDKHLQEFLIRVISGSKKPQGSKRQL